MMGEAMMFETSTAKMIQAQGSLFTRLETCVMKQTSANRCCFLNPAALQHTSVTKIPELFMNATPMQPLGCCY